jgi:hypothetical protein
MRLFSQSIALAAITATLLLSPLVAVAEGEGSDGFTPHVWTTAGALEVGSASVPASAPKHVSAVRRHASIAKRTQHGARKAAAAPSRKRLGSTARA